MEQDDFLLLLGKQIAKYRNQAAISQKELALRCDMEKSAITRLEKGRTNPTSLTLFKICEALGIVVSQLFEFQKTSRNKSF